MAGALLNLICVVGGAFLLSMQFGWMAGCGAALLVFFLKDAGGG